MSETEENRLRDVQLASIGKMLAGYTHELKNHLAIINESSGLMGDLLEPGPVINEQLRQRFQKIIAMIEERIVQVNTMAKLLNNFAHRMDQADSLFDVNELLFEELAFLARFSRLKSIALQTNLLPDLPAVQTNPSLFAFVFFSLIQKTIEMSDAGGEITVSSQKDDQHIIITINSKGATPSPAHQDIRSQPDTAVTYALEKMGIAIRRQELKEGIHRTTLAIPLHEKCEQASLISFCETGGGKDSEKKP